MCVLYTSVRTTVTVLCVQLATFDVDVESPTKLEELSSRARFVSAAWGGRRKLTM